MSESDDTPTLNLTYAGGFDAVVARMEARRDPLSFSEGEALPPLDFDLAPLTKKLVQALDPKDIPRAKDQSGNTRKSIDLNAEFVGLPELCKLHGLLIAHLRKSEQPSHTMALFTRLWAEQADDLFRHLDPRWLVSAITTFGDHGQTEVQRRIGQSMTVLFATMKLYETERLYSGFKPQQEFKLKRLVRRKLPLNMDRYVLSSGGLDVNMLGRLWVDARADTVIAPLAHHLLDLLNGDPGTVFRRFKTLRGREMRQQELDRAAAIAAQADATTALEPTKPDIQRAPNSWGIVSTVKASADVLSKFIDHHLAFGASQIFLFLDDPLPESEMTKIARPQVTLVTCDAAYWELSGRPRMEAHQNRQAFNATRAYRAAKTEWLAHIDCDEFLFSDTPVTETLRAADAKTLALVMPPAQEIVPIDPQDELLFRRTYFDAGCKKSDLTALFPTFGEYLHSGFISHTAGKSMARVGLPDVRFGIHGLKRGGEKIAEAERIQTLTVLHRHAPDWPTFERHMKFRLAKGSYRNPGQSRLSLGDVLDALEEEHGASGARQLFDEICTARPNVVETLEKLGMLIRTKLREAPDV